MPRHFRRRIYIELTPAGEVELRQGWEARQRRRASRADPRMVEALYPRQRRLTPDQRDLFDLLKTGQQVPGGEFTSEQVRNFTVLGFRHICQLEGVGVPSPSVVLDEIDRRNPGWPGHWSEPRQLVRPSEL